MIVGGKVFTAGQTGSRLQDVVCEKCKTKFCYELVRTGIGKGSAVYMIGQDSAKNRAASAAGRALQKRLNEEAELVPCPKCNWVNSDLVERYRARQYRRAPALFGLIMLGGFTLSPLVYALLAEILGFNSVIPWVVMAAMEAVCLLSPAWVLLIRRQLRLAVDPNLTYPRPPVVPPGTPPTLFRRTDPRTGQTALVIVPRKTELQPIEANWVQYRPGQIRFPALCCICMLPQETVYRPPMQINGKKGLQMPLCKACAGQLRIRWWTMLAIVAGSALGLASILAAALPFGDPAGRWMTFEMLGAMTALIGGVIGASILSRPYRHGVVDSDRGIWKLSAPNSEFTALLCEQVRRSEGGST